MDQPSVESGSGPRARTEIEGHAERGGRWTVAPPGWRVIGPVGRLMVMRDATVALCAARTQQHTAHRPVPFLLILEQ